MQGLGQRRGSCWLQWLDEQLKVFSSRTQPAKKTSNHSTGSWTFQGLVSALDTGYGSLPRRGTAAIEATDIAKRDQLEAQGSAGVSARFGSVIDRAGHGQHAAARPVRRYRPYHQSPAGAVGARPRWNRLGCCGRQPEIRRETIVGGCLSRPCLARPFGRPARKRGLFCDTLG